MKRVYTKAIVGLLCSMLVLALPTILYAHAVLMDSNPKANSTVKGPTLSVWLRFNVRVDGSRSRSSLVLTDGTTLPLTLDTQAKPNLLSARATGLSPGKYKLQWQVLAADGHITRGEFTFSIE
jgi:methionine-rich copper-binding protein CopC